VLFILIAWVGNLGAAAVAKLVAACVAYPHEVIRTRLREPAKNGVLKYTGLLQCLKLVIKEEGLVSLYGGMTAHLMRVVPNAAIMFFCYEAILHNFGQEKTHQS
jgi:solute carrier family 25 protein 33/36